MNICQHVPDVIQVQYYDNLLNSLSTHFEKNDIPDLMTPEFSRKIISSFIMVPCLRFDCHALTQKATRGSKPVL